MCRKYRPSNGTEGLGFMETYCFHCIHDNGDTKICDILSKAMLFNVKDKDYPKYWTYDERGRATCTAYRKWHWGKDDEGNWIEPEPPPIDDPNQLCLLFILDELEIKKHENKNIPLSEEKTLA